MAWLARLLLLIPMAVAGLLVSGAHIPVLALAIALLLLALTIVGAFYGPTVMDRFSEWRSEDAPRP